MTLPASLENSPRLALYARELNALLARERNARECYYAELNEDLKAEFINGEVVVRPPARHEHVECAKLILKLLDTFVSKQRLGFVGHEKLTVALTRNDYEPDIAFWRSEVAASFARSQTKFPAPDLIVEVLSPSTEARDRGLKMDDYAAHGVREYWLVDPATRVLEQYLLQGDGFELALKSASGDVESKVIVGFHAPIAALFDAQSNLEALKTILVG